MGLRLLSVFAFGENIFLATAQIFPVWQARKMNMDVKENKMILQRRLWIEPCLFFCPKPQDPVLCPSDNGFLPNNSLFAIMTMSPITCEPCKYNPKHAQIEQKKNHHWMRLLILEASKCRSRAQQLVAGSSYINPAIQKWGQQNMCTWMKCKPSSPPFYLIWRRLAKKR